MIHEDARFVFTLSAEIYNERRWRSELAGKGRQFPTQTDTEVLLTAWQEWGEAALARLNGMFAFALWDDQKRSLFLVRDRVGIKPLYYTECQKPDPGVPSRASRLGWDGKGGQLSFLFASEVKSILAS